MINLKVLFVGIGSIAKRHIRNLSVVCRRQGIKLAVDAVRSGKGQPMPPDIAGIVSNVYQSPVDVPSGYDITFITNPTRCHMDALEEYQHKAENFFIEKPLVDREQLDEMRRAKIDIKGIAYVACPLRYTNVMQYVKQYIDISKVHSVRAISSSYLPDWRPGQDYRDTYSAHRDMGGGVSVDLIHEWDYLQYLFGSPMEVKSIIEKVSNLEIDSDDLAVYIARYEDKIIELHLDYFGRVPERRIELYMDDDTVIADLINGNIGFLKSNNVVDLSEKRDDYQTKELEYFLSLLENPSQEFNDVETAMKTLALTMGEV